MTNTNFDHTTGVDENLVEFFLMTTAFEELINNDLIKDGWIVHIVDSLGNNAGKTNYERKVIMFSRELIFDTYRANLIELVKHEIAHALTTGQGEHSQAWYDKLMSIGGTGFWYNSDGDKNHVKLDTEVIDG